MIKAYFDAAMARAQYPNSRASGQAGQRWRSVAGIWWILAAREEPEGFPRKVMIYTLGHLYGQGKISSGLGAQVLGCDRREFYRLLSAEGFAIVDYPAEELELEAQTSREIAARVTNR